MSILFSRPLTFPRAPDLPGSLRPWANEGALSFEFGQRYPGWISEPMLRSHLAAALLWRRGAFGGIVTGRYGELFAALQGMWPFGRRPHLLLDVEWPHRHASWSRRLISRLFHRAIASGAWKIQVFCEVEADHYAEYFGIERNKFIWIPYCTDPEAPAMASAGEYLFTGGMQNRDYETLFHAVRDLDLPVTVAAPAERIDRRWLAPNMRVTGQVSRAEFWRCLAGARMVVLSLEDRLLRCPGVITYVTAMRLGKCVIVNEPKGTHSYIRHGETGMIVPAKDPASLRAAVLAVWHDDQRRRQLSESARIDSAERFCVARYLKDLQGAIRDMQAN